MMNIIVMDNCTTDRLSRRGDFIGLQLLKNFEYWGEYLDSLDEQIAQEKINIQAKLLEFESMIWK